jgi:Prokaryotic Cytochrome C oxidase subunit IV
MTTLTPLLRTRTTAVWLVLTLATLLSWSLGGHHTLGMSQSHAAAGISILLIAFVKIRFVGLYFMELRGAPTALRTIFEIYCVVVCATLGLLYLLA